MISLRLRFYEELNDFIPLEKRKKCSLDAPYRS